MAKTALLLEKNLVTLLALVTKCVRIIADFPNAYVKKDLLGRTLVKMSMNVKTEMTVTLTLCAPTQKDHMFVVVSGVMKVTAEIAQLWVWPVLLLVAPTLFVKQILDFLYVHATLVSKVTDTIAQT